MLGHVGQYRSCQWPALRVHPAIAFLERPKGFPLSRHITQKARSVRPVGQSYQEISASRCEAGNFGKILSEQQFRRLAVGQQGAMQVNKARDQPVKLAP